MNPLTFRVLLHYITYTFYNDTYVLLSKYTGSLYNTIIDACVKQLPNT